MKSNMSVELVTCSIAKPLGTCTYTITIPPQYRLPDNARRVGHQAKLYSEPFSEHDSYTSTH
ncbi:MAG: hypothetical protein NVSMB49_07590 [Ktedonobacteraceae bacterium]